MNLIVSVDNNWGIGYENGLLFHLPEDLKFFKSMTTGKNVVMGEKTFFSLPRQKPLPNRNNIVLSDNKELKIDGVIVVNTLDDLLEELKKYDADDVFIIGGQAVYSLMLPYCSTAYVTHVDAVKKADKFFPNLKEMKDWKLVYTSEPQNSGELCFTYNTYKRI